MPHLASSSGRRRFSLSSFTSSSSSSSSCSTSLHRLSTISDQPLPLRDSNQPLRTIPFAEPPFMPMFKSHSPTETVQEMERSNEGKQQLRVSTSTSSSSRPTSQSTSSPSAPSTPTSRHSTRFFRRLHRRGNGRGELDFGCVGEWNEGPSDLVRLPFRQCFGAFQS